MTAQDVAITLLACNRPLHTSRVLQAIRDEGITRFTIFMDAPVTREDAEAQIQLEMLFTEIDWADTRLIKRSSNMGLAASVVSAVTEQLEKHQSIILLEDDCCPFPGFFHFMKRALQKYASNQKIRSICGYQYPFICNGSANISALALSRFNPWGWATWRSRWDDHTTDLSHLISQIKCNGIYARLSSDLQDLCHEDYFVEQKADIWSINWALIHYLTDTYAVFPSRTLIANIGFDGTGVHSVKTDAFEVDKSYIEEKKYSVTLPEKPVLNKKINTLIERFLQRHGGKVMYKHLHHTLIHGGSD
jgi:hypothetical protein